MPKFPSYRNQSIDLTGFFMMATLAFNELIFNLHPRIISGGGWKCKWVAFQKASKSYPIYFFLLQRHAMLFNSKTKRLMEYTWLKQLKKYKACTVCLYVDCLSRITDTAQKEKHLLSHKKWTQKTCLKQSKHIDRHTRSTQKKKTVTHHWTFVLRICSSVYVFNISSLVLY